MLLSSNWLRFFPPWLPNNVWPWVTAPPQWLKQVLILFLTRCVNIAWWGSLRLEFCVLFLYIWIVSKYRVFVNRIQPIWMRRSARLRLFQAKFGVPVNRVSLRHTQKSVRDSWLDPLGFHAGVLARGYILSWVRCASHFSDWQSSIWITCLSTIHSLIKALS